MLRAVNENSPRITITLFTTVFFYFFVAVNYYQVPYLWSINLLSYQTLSIQFLIILTLPMLIVLLYERTVSYFLEILEDFTATRSRLIISLSLLMLTLLLLSIVFKSETALLGDGTLRINQINNSGNILFTEALDYLAHLAVFKFILKPLNFKAMMSYQLISLMCGPLFIFALYRLVKYLFRKNHLLIMLTLLSSGIIVLFFGYVESYAIIAVLLPVVFLHGIKTCEGNASIKSYLLIVLIACGVHSVAILIFLPSLFFVVMRKYFNQSSNINLLKIMLGGTGLVVIIGYLFNYIFKPAAPYLLPLVPSEFYNQGIFTFNHIMNLTNWVILAAMPIIIVILIMFFGKNIFKLFISRRITFAFSVLIPSLAFIFFFTPQLGGARDWDLFSLPLFAILLALIAIMSRSVNSHYLRYLLPIIFLSAINSFSFAMVNNNQILSVNRFENIIEVNRFKNLTKEYLTLVNLCETEKSLVPLTHMYLRKTLNEPPYNLKDSLRVLNMLSQSYLDRNDSTLAVRFNKIAMATDSLDLTAWLTRVSILQKYGKDNSILIVAEQIENRFPDKALGQMNAGIIYMQNKQFERGGRALKKSLKLGSDDYRLYLNYGIYQIQQKSNDSALFYFDQSLKINENNFLTHYYCAYIYKSKNEKKKYWYHLVTAEELAGSVNQKKLVAQLRK